MTYIGGDPEKKWNILDDDAETDATTRRTFKKTQANE